MIPGPVTRELCAAACDRCNYTLAGVEAGGQCFCGNALRGNPAAARSDQPPAAAFQLVANHLFLDRLGSVGKDGLDLGPALLLIDQLVSAA